MFVAFGLLAFAALYVWVLIFGRTPRTYMSGKNARPRDVPPPRRVVKK
jgi:hypothetical protein